jgi:hypothetical protein
LKYYYSIPFDTKSLVDKKRHPLCDIKESVQMNINLIIKTHFREYRYNSTYGCFIWNQDYSSVTSVSKWIDELNSSILSSIEINESRINNVEVKLDLEEADVLEKFKNQPLRLKHKITISIKGVIKHLNEPFEHIEYLFFSPLSVG